MYDRPVTPVSRLSEIRMFTVVSLETLKFKAVMNKQRMNATELLLYLWLVLSVDSICCVCFRGKWRHYDREMKVLTNLQASNTELILLCWVNTAWTFLGCFVLEQSLTSNCKGIFLWNDDQYISSWRSVTVVNVQFMMFSVLNRLLFPSERKSTKINKAATSLIKTYINSLWSIVLQIKYSNARTWGWNWSDVHLCVT